MKWAVLVWLLLVQPAFAEEDVLTKKSGSWEYGYKEGTANVVALAIAPSGSALMMVCEAFGEGCSFKVLMERSCVKDGTYHALVLSGDKSAPTAMTCTDRSESGNVYEYTMDNFEVVATLMTLGPVTAIAFGESGGKVAVVRFPTDGLLTVLKYVKTVVDNNVRKQGQKSPQLKDESL